MKLERPLATFDVEATDPEPTTCAIWEYAVVVLLPDGTRKEAVKRFKPWKPVTPEVEELCGVTNAELEECPPFSEFAAAIASSLVGKDLAGYNLNRFDLVCLDEELRRCGLKLDLTDVRVIDAYGIFANKEGRKLTDAVMKYCGRSHEDAHGALADAAATLDVLQGQLCVYPDLGEMDLAALAAFSRVGGSEDGRTPVDLAGKLYRDKEGRVCYAFGKCKGATVESDPGFANWMLRQTNPGFPGSTCEALEAEFERLWPRKQGTL